MDPENLGPHVLHALGPRATTAVRSALGPLLHYHPANPTAVYSLLLGQRAHRTVAKRLLLAFTQQWDAGFSTHPYRMAFTTCSVGGKVRNSDRWIGRGDNSWLDGRGGIHPALVRAPPGA